MSVPQSTENDVASIRARDAASAETWFKGPAGLPEGFGACGKAFNDRRWLLGEIDRQQTEAYRWHSVAATRNANIVTIAEERDAERTKRLQAEHERDCAVEDVKRLTKQLAQSCDQAQSDPEYGGCPLERRAVDARSTEGTCTCPQHLDPLGCAAKTCPRAIAARSAVDVPGDANG